MITTMVKTKKTWLEALNSTAGFTLASVLCGLMAGGIVLALTGYNPFTAYYVIIKGVISKPKYIAYTLITATPLILTGISLAFAFRTGLFNIGAEGQFIVGALTAALLGYYLPLPPVIHVLVIIICAGAAAAVWGGLAGYLKARFGVHEVITTIMLNWIAYYLNNFIISLPGIARDAGVFATHDIRATARIDILGVWKLSDEGLAWLANQPFWRDLLKAPINFGFLFAVLLAVAGWFILKKTTLGYKLCAVGFNKHAAEYGGINVKSCLITSMALAGFVAGLAGAFHVMGNTLKVANLAAMEGFGFDGIAVALIGNSDPLGAIFGGILFGILKYGGSKIQNELGAPTEIINIIIGTIVFFIALPKLIQLIFRLKLKLKGKSGGETHV